MTAESRAPPFVIRFRPNRCPGRRNSPMAETIDITQLRVQIRDRDALLSVSITNMRAYLTAAV